MPDDPRESRDFVPTESRLPPGRAFVVQLRSGTGDGDEIFVGRVEHIVSGEVRRFASAAELLASIAEIDAAQPATTGKGRTT
jgi:hypothetical protein